MSKDEDLYKAGDELVAVFIRKLIDDEPEEVVNICVEANKSLRGLLLKIDELVKIINKLEEDDDC